MIEFMRFCFQTGNSAFWNPYSGMGSLGPDSLVDQKFSVFTVLNALLGGGSLVYNVTLLISYTAAVFFCTAFPLKSCNCRRLQVRLRQFSICSMDLASRT
jgi:hypothetical protein